MAKLEIKTRSWVHKGNGLVAFDALSDAEREALATQLKVTWLNSLFAGVATFKQETPQP